MIHFRLTTALFAAVIGAAVVAPGASAGIWDQKTIVKISDPISVAGIVLQPGSYVFKLVQPNQADQQTVQISNVREDHVYGTVLAIPLERTEREAGSGKSTFQFWETPAGQPKALRAWYYPAEFFGHGFPYKAQVTQTSQVTQQTTPAPTPVAEAPAAPEPKPVVAENAPPPPPVETPAPVQEATPAPQPEPQAVAENIVPKTIPQTAGNLPLLALLGFGSLTLAAAISAFAKVIG
jgi:hypothetical protein